MTDTVRAQMHVIPQCIKKHIPFRIKELRIAVIAITVCYAALTCIQWVRSLSNCDCLSIQLWTTTVEVASINGQIDIIGYNSRPAKAAIVYTRCNMRDIEYLEYINRMREIAAGGFIYLYIRYWQLFASAGVLCGVVLWWARDESRRGGPGIALDVWVTKEQEEREGENKRVETL